jgi:ribosomal protein S27AE
VEELLEARLGKKTAKSKLCPRCATCLLGRHKNNKNPRSEIEQTHNIGIIGPENQGGQKLCLVFYLPPQRRTNRAEAQSATMATLGRFVCGAP